MLKAKYLITLLFIFISAKANFLYGDIYYGIFIFILVLLCVKKTTLQQISRIVIIFLTLAGSFYVRNRINQLDSGYYISDVLYLCKYAFMTYLYCIYMGKSILHYLVKVISQLALISLFLYPLQLISGGVIITSIGKIFSFILPAYSRNTEYVNFLVFSFQPRHSIRNSGFSWEPGAYGCFLVLALLYNLFLSRFNFTRESKILIIATITTLSTTANLALLMVILLKYLQNGGKFNAKNVVITVILAIVFFNIPFLGEKIYNSFFIDSDAVDNIDNVTDYYYNLNTTIPLGRFASVSFIVQQFGLKLFWGISNDYSRLYISMYNVNLSCGIIDFIAKFGLIGYVAMSRAYWNFCKLGLVDKKIISLAICFMIFFILGFGETILNLPFFLSVFFIRESIKDKDRNALKVSNRKLFNGLHYYTGT